MNPQPLISLLALAIVFAPIEPTHSASHPITSSQTTLPAKETAIDRLVVSLFKANVKDKKLAALWNQRREDFQQIFLITLNERSYLDAAISNNEYSLREDKDTILDEARDSGVDGVLVGEYQGTTIEMALRSGATGRTLARWSIPASKLGDQGDRVTISQAVKAVVVEFPYRGFIIGTSGSEAKLNLGRRHGVKVGTHLEIFELQGSKPNLSSPKKILGELKITRVNPDEAVGEVIRSYFPITPYSKVAFSQSGEKEDLDSAIDTRYNDRLWLTVAGEFNSLDTQLSDDASNLRKRQYQIPISPLMAFGLGYHRLSLEAALGSANNTSNKVNYLIGDGTLEIKSFRSGYKAFIASLGAHYEKFTANVQPGATLPLTTITSYSPLLEIRAQFTTSPATKIFGTLGIMYPYFSSDPDNGSTNSSLSGGFSLQTGVRVDLSRHLGVESGAHGRYIRMIMEQSKFETAEIMFGFFTRMLILF